MPEGNELLGKERLQWCELELFLRAGALVGENKSYYVFPRFWRPNDTIDTRMPPIPPVVIEQKRLDERKGDPVAYGKALWAMLFDDAQMRQMLDIATTNAHALRVALRLRLFIGHDALELHGIWWETLIDPDTGSPIVMREDFVFSRYLDSPAGAPAEPPDARRVRVLYVVANPSDLDQWEVNGRALGRPVMDDQWLPSEVADRLDVVTLGDRVPVTLDNVIARLRQGFDVLYLVCHGALVDNQSRLFLENDDGRTAVVTGDSLAVRLRDMVAQPRLIVLASCQSAGTGGAVSVGDDGELAALGPRLMDAGVPAVIAMQGNVTVRAVRCFMPVLFEQLAVHGHVERAVAVARGAVREQRDWWIPVLFTRLKTGELWDAPPQQQPGPSQRNDDYDWQKIVEDLKANMSVMVLGSGMGEEVLGSSREIANAWVKDYNFPLALNQRDSLPQVSQYLACTQNRNFPLMQLRKYLIYSLPIRHLELLRDYCGTVGGTDELDALVREIGSRMRARVQEKQQANDKAREEARRRGMPAVLPHPDVTELAYTQIARLPVTTFVTTNRDNLLFDSLKAEGRDPEVAVCRWKPVLTDTDAAEEQDWPLSVFDREPGYKPTYDRPLIYHVFGNTRYPHTIVLTEDDYFDFLVGLSRNQGNPRTSMPAHIKMVLATHGLMFLGFQFDDWEFRTMFRGVLPREGVEAGVGHSNVAVQIEPDEGMPTAQEARNYMKKYFSQHRQIQVYWGKPEEFLTELTKLWKRSTQ